MWPCYRRIGMGVSMLVYRLEKESSRSWPRQPRRFCVGWEQRMFAYVGSALPNRWGAYLRFPWSCHAPFLPMLCVGILLLVACGPDQAASSNVSSGNIQECASPRGTADPNELVTEVPSQCRPTTQPSAIARHSVRCDYAGRSSEDQPWEGDASVTAEPGRPGRAHVQDMVLQPVLSEEDAQFTLGVFTPAGERVAIMIIRDPLPPRYLFGPLMVRHSADAREITVTCSSITAP